MTELKRAYEAWSRDVSHTQPDNYAPPRIYVGMSHENPVTLPRQDCRHEKGRPWAEDSNGHWLPYVAESGSQEISLRLHPEKEAGDAVLGIGDDEWKQPFSAGQEPILFQTVRLGKGNATLKATLTAGKTTKGPWQVDVTRKETQDRDE